MKHFISAALAALALLEPMAATAQTSNRPAVLATPGGRYVFGQVSEFKSDQYLLDTQTGRMWKFITFCADTTKKETCGDPVMRPVEFQVQVEPDDLYLPGTSVAKPARAASPPEPKKK